MQVRVGDPGHDDLVVWQPPALRLRTNQVLEIGFTAHGQHAPATDGDPLLPAKAMVAGECGHSPADQQIGALAQPGHSSAASASRSSPAAKASATMTRDLGPS